MAKGGNSLREQESPVLKIDLLKVRNNAAKIVDKCKNAGISVLGVTKGFNALPEIVVAMVAGGIGALTDSRMENIMAMRKAGFKQPMTLLRIPRLSNVENVIAYANVSVNSELAVIQALSQAAKKQQKKHQILLMVDVGDLREGVMPSNVLSLVRQIIKLDSVELIGLGTNMGCFGGVLPDCHNLGLLVELGKLIEKEFTFRLNVISGGGTSTLKLVEDEAIPPGINQLRIGEGVLLGTDTTHGRAIPWLEQDAFRLFVEVIEVKAKPSVPIGNIGHDVFGQVPHFEDVGIRNRAIVAIGKQDVYIEGLMPVDRNIIVLGASSDHLILDITDVGHRIQVGDLIEFSLSYSGLLLACSSPYITKVFAGGNYYDSTD